MLNQFYLYSLVWEMGMMAFGILSAILLQIRRDPEVLDWFHLMENLHKVGGSLKRLKQAKNFLWKGQVSEAIAKERSAFSNRPLR
jgi:hypothetical protein